MASLRSGDRPRKIRFRGPGPENESKVNLSKDGPAQVGIMVCSRAASLLANGTVFGCGLACRRRVLVSAGVAVQTQLRGEG